MGFSRITTFKVFLNFRVGHIGSDVIITVSHFHHDVAKLTILNPAVHNYYEELHHHLITYNVYFFCTDANMNLLLTKRYLTNIGEECGKPFTKYVALASWYP